MIRTSGRRVARLLPACALALACVSAHAVQGALRLLMFDAEDCAYCAQWDEEVGAIYARTDEGRAAPLARTPLAAAVDDAAIRLREPVRYAPTFVLLRDGDEVGRITGYPGEEHFWGLLGVLLQRSTEH